MKGRGEKLFNQSRIGQVRADNIIMQATRKVGQLVTFAVEQHLCSPPGSSWPCGWSKLEQAAAAAAAPLLFLFVQLYSYLRAQAKLSARISLLLALLLLLLLLLPLLVCMARCSSGCQVGPVRGAQVALYPSIYLAISPVASCECLRTAHSLAIIDYWPFALSARSRLQRLARRRACNARCRCECFSARLKLYDGRPRRKPLETLLA